MAGEKFLFVNTDNEYEEDVAAVSSSAGVGDADKLIKTNGSGLIDPSFIPALDNILDWKESCRVAVETNVNLAAPGVTLDGVTMNNGDRVLLTGQTTGSQNGIYVFNGAASAMTRATDADEDSEVSAQLRTPIEEGTRADQIGYLTTNDPITVDTTALTFAFQNPTNLVAGAGIDISSSIVSVDLLDSDSGLELVGVGNAAELAIDFADTATEMATQRAVAAADLSANGANQGAKILGADPASISQSSATTIQGILEDLSSALETAADSGSGVDYTVGTGGVTAGDLVRINANDTVVPLDITTNQVGIGIAFTTESAAGTVKVAANDEIVAGVLTGATAGQKIWWNGSALTTTAPSASGDRVWLAGIAKNATDLHVQVTFVKRNA